MIVSFVSHRWMSCKSSVCEGVAAGQVAGELGSRRRVSISPSLFRRVSVMRSPSRRGGAASVLAPLMLVWLAAAAPDTSPTTQADLDVPMTRSVLLTAMEFLSSRTLAPHTAREFSLWGLGGVSALDPGLHVEERGHAVTLLSGQTVTLSRDEPAEGDLRGWAELDTALLANAWTQSDTIRAAHADGVVQSFFDELFNHLDPYSRYVGPAPAKTDREERSGGDGEIGVSLGEDTTVSSGGRRRARHEREVIVTAVNANGPAWPAGVDVGERLISVDGRSVAGRAPAEIEQSLRGAPNSVVTLRLAPPLGGAARNVSLRRAQVPPETVFAFASDPLVVLRITSFSSDTAEEMSQYLDQAAQDGRMRGLVIDLRGNRGGVLQQAVTAAALLMDRGVAVVTQGRDPQSNHIWAVQGGDMTNGAPIAILVDGRTASAAEILAAALSDHRRAVVIGSATLGKGLVQTVAQLPDGGELFVTWSRVIAPLGWPLQGLGVMPQICTSRGAADAQRQMDALRAGRALDSRSVVRSREVRLPDSVSQLLDIRKACPAALGGDNDLDQARVLLGDRTAYRAALEMVPEGTQTAAPKE